MDFSIQIEPQLGYTFDDVVNIAQVAVDQGFSTIWFSDHFMLDVDATNRVLLDPWLLMTALVQVNSKVRVGSMVFCQSYRNPALTAKMAATLDTLSKGRLEFGIGAGWKEIEYKTYGYPFPDAKTRIGQLIDAIQIIKGIWTNERYTFKGKYYSVEDVISSPKPVQTPLPVWVGAASGKKLMLRVTAQYGDGVNLAWALPPKACQQRFTQLTKLCQKFGREATELKKSVGIWTRYFESQEAMDAAITENAKERGIPEQEYRERVSSTLWGTANDMVDRIREYEQIGVSHLILMLPYKGELAQIESIGRNVLSKV